MHTVTLSHWVFTHSFKIVVAQWSILIIIIFFSHFCSNLGQRLPTTSSTFHEPAHPISFEGTEIVRSAIFSMAWRDQFCAILAYKQIFKQLTFCIPSLCKLELCHIPAPPPVYFRERGKKFSKTPSVTCNTIMFNFYHPIMIITVSLVTTRVLTNWHQTMVLWILTVLLHLRCSVHLYLHNCLIQFK